MNTLPIHDLTDSISELLTEAYIGPPDANSPTWFVDNDPNAGIFGQIKNLNALEASTSVDGTGNRGTTIASHVEHLRWSLSNASGAMRGEPYQSNWKESWNVIAVNADEWDRLREELNHEFQIIRNAIKKQENLDGPFLNGVLALIPHAAYHLATIRQMIERVHSE